MQASRPSRRSAVATLSSVTKVSPGDFFTLANGALGFIAITYVLDGSYLIATALLFLSMVMDGLDGFFARKFGSKHSMGQVLDSISDSISFAFAPAFLLYGELHDIASTSPTYSLWNVAVLAGAVCFLSCGLFRLARFSVSGYQLKYFVGMPAPGAAMFLLLVCLLFGAESGTEPWDLYFVVWDLPWLVLGLGFVLSYLMASEIPYPKVRCWMAKHAGAAMAVSAPILAAGLVLVADQSLYTASSRTAATIALALMLVYSLGGPIYERHKRG